MTLPFQLPDLKDTEAMQRFFLQEVQLGEELLATGNILPHFIIFLGYQPPLILRKYPSFTTLLI